MRRFLPLAVLFGLASPALAQPSKLPPDLALVPETGMAIIHVKVAELWGQESLKDVRDILKKAGDKAIASLDCAIRRLEAPANVERITVWIGPSRSRSTIDSDLLFFLRMTKPVDPAKLRKLIVPDAKEIKGKRFNWYVDESGAGFLIADDRTFVLGSKDEVAKIANVDPSIGSFLRESIAVAAGDRPLVVGIVPSALPARWQSAIMKLVPATIHPMMIVKSGIVSLDLVGEGHLHLQLAYPTTTGAEAGERMIKGRERPGAKIDCQDAQGAGSDPPRQQAGGIGAIADGGDRRHGTWVIETGRGAARYGQGAARRIERPGHARTANRLEGDPGPSRVRDRGGDWSICEPVAGGVASNEERRCS